MGICEDGILNVEGYDHAPVKIVWVLKEPLYDGDLGEQLDNAIKNHLYGPTWLTMAYAAYATLAGWKSGNFTAWKTVPTLDGGVLESLRQVAVVNVKKETCTAKNGYSDNDEIMSEYISQRRMINDQIADLDADIIVFGHPEKLKCIVEDIFKTQTGENRYRVDELFGDFAATTAEVNGKRKLFLWGYHPGFYRGEEEGEHSRYKYFTDFIAAVKEFRAGK